MKVVNLVENSKSASDCGCEHGLSFYIETKKHKLLMDSGATGMFLKNAQILGIDLRDADTMVLSHGHYDHAGGILAFSELNPDAKIYLRSSAKEEYYHLKENGPKYIGIDKEILKLNQCVFVQGDLRIDEELFLYTDIRGVKYQTKGNLSLKKKIGGKFVPDTFGHEQCLVITQNNQRVLLSGCAHSGIVNILDRYKEIFHSDPDLVISGFHLKQEEGYSAGDRFLIRDMAHVLAEMDTIFYTGHCTGKEAYDIMKEIMGDQLREIHSGELIWQD